MLYDMICITMKFKFFLIKLAAILSFVPIIIPVNRVLAAPPSNPIPVITGISPESVIVGSPSFTMTVNGAGFISTSIVRFDGIARNTNFISNTQLTVTIIANDLNSTGAFPVTVFNHPPGGGISNTQIFTVKPAPIPLPPTAGGQPTEIKFSGRAYPGAKVTIYAKDANTQFPIKQEEIESSDGTFKTNYRGIPQNAYNYSLVITDKDNRNSQVKSYNLDVYANSLNVKNIFVSPTLGLLRSVVTKGDFITATGYAAPDSDVEFEVDDRLISGKTSAEKDGHYKWLFNTAGLNFGEHRVKARQIGGFNTKSDWSPTVIFSVSAILNPKTDLNSDGIINISDWSVFLSSFKSENESVKKRVDLNGDGKTNISDFSVFLKTLKSSGKF